MLHSTVQLTTSQEHRTTLQNKSLSTNLRCTVQYNSKRVKNVVLHFKTS